MLQFVTHSFEFSVERLESARLLVISYAGLLAAKGYLARRSYAIREDHEGRLEILGIACGPDCLDVATDDRQIEEILRHVDQLSPLKQRVSYEVASGTVDEQYGHDRPWEHVLLVPDCVHGISSLRDANGGLIGRYRLELDDELCESLWTWEVQYECIYNCWLASADYERWAARELGSKSSHLNRRGARLAERLRQTIGCTVEYRPHELKDA